MATFLAMMIPRKSVNLIKLKSKKGIPLPSEQQKRRSHERNAQTVGRLVSQGKICFIAVISAASERISVSHRKPYNDIIPKFPVIVKGGKGQISALSAVFLVDYL
ncbi:MAG: hypothetical protein IKV57_05905 [Clostridia bacterium]|nr:hypothetical protein [Clostridia bacterium]